MRQEHKDWIEANVPKAYGKCAEVTLAMQAAFPDLVRVRGHYHDIAWGKRAHWWLKDGDEIVDPTASQFPGEGLDEYEEWDESTPEPNARCLNCGTNFHSPTAGMAYSCSPACSKALEAEYA